jgi:membrane protease YdiL (CAAX protease family)
VIDREGSTARLGRQTTVAEPPQLSRRAILLVWAAATAPMAAISWGVAPIAARVTGGSDALVRALLVGLTAGLVWQFVLVVVLVARERRLPGWSGWRSALWLQAPQRDQDETDTDTGRTRLVRSGGRLWWVLAPMLVAFAAASALPTLPVPADRDLAAFLGSADGEAFLHGAWGWFGVVVLLVVFNTVLGEELLFRGYLLPRMRATFGRGDWVANGLLFATYHLHTPWVIPIALLDTVILSYPCRRYRTALLGILVHSSQSVFFLAIILPLVL